MPISNITLKETMMPRKSDKKACASDISATGVSQFRFSIPQGGGNMARPDKEFDFSEYKGDGNIQGFLVASGWTISAYADPNEKDDAKKEPAGVTYTGTLNKLTIDYSSLASCSCEKGANKRSYRLKLEMGEDDSVPKVEFFDDPGEKSGGDVKHLIEDKEKVKVTKVEDKNRSTETVTYTLTDKVECPCSDKEPCTFEFVISFDHVI